MDFELIQLIVMFTLIAVIYSSAGFGGGSSYLAILALIGDSFPSIRMIALLCNITVVTASVILMHKHKFLDIKKNIPLIMLSIPLAFLGGRFKMEESTFFIILGFSLLIASFLMFFFNYKNQHKKRFNISNIGTGIIGGGIGFLSGVVGIGGGIFLSPILHLTRWAEVKKIAAATALFILVNSIAGLLGQITNHGFVVNPLHAISLMIAVFVGGQVGVHLSINILSPRIIKRITAILIFLVAIRLIYKNLALF